MTDTQTQQTQRTDSRPLYERRASVRLRVAELRTALAAATAAQLEIDAAIAALGEAAQ